MFSFFHFLLSTLLVFLFTYFFSYFVLFTLFPLLFFSFCYLHFYTRYFFLFNQIFSNVARYYSFPNFFILDFPLRSTFHPSSKSFTNLRSHSCQKRIIHFYILLLFASQDPANSSQDFNQKQQSVNLTRHDRFS